MKSGKQSSEFWVVSFLLGVWGIKSLGLDLYLAPSNMDELVRAIQAKGESSQIIPQVMALVYVVGRTWLKGKIPSDVSSAFKNIESQFSSDSSKTNRE
jgi:hypothetical protein